MKVDSKLRRQVEKIVTKHRRAFAGMGAGEVGKCSLVTFDIEMKDGVVPVRHRSRPLNPEVVRCADR